MFSPKRYQIFPKYLKKNGLGIKWLSSVDMVWSKNNLT